MKSTTGTEMIGSTENTNPKIISASRQCGLHTPERERIILRHYCAIESCINSWSL